MFLPIGDTPNPKQFTPYVNYGLIVANVVVYLFISLPLGLSHPDPTSSAFVEYLTFLQHFVPSDIPIQAVAAQLSAYDVFVWAGLESAESLGNFLRTKVGVIDGVQRTETFVNLSIKKRTYGLVL